MAAIRNDLLSNTRVLLRWAFFINAGIALILGIVTAGAMAGDLSDVNTWRWTTIEPAQKAFTIRVVVSSWFATLLLTLPVLWKLRAIVDSAREGDPFAPVNATRLRHIGGLVLGINVLTTIAVQLPLEGHVSVPPVTFTGVVTVLMIFVLARIFETGTRMRTELQETI